MRRKKEYFAVQFQHVNREDYKDREENMWIVLGNALEVNLPRFLSWLRMQEYS